MIEIEKLCSLNIDWRPCVYLLHQPDFTLSFRSRDSAESLVFPKIIATWSDAELMENRKCRGNQRLEAVLDVCGNLVFSRLLQHKRNGIFISRRKCMGNKVGFETVKTGGCCWHK